jgi:hypothetical protein
MTDQGPKETFAEMLGKLVLALAALAVNVAVFFYVGVPFADWLIDLPGLRDRETMDFLPTMLWLFAIVIPNCFIWPITETLYAKATGNRDNETTGDE